MVSLKHKFVNAHADGVDTTVVRPSNWNDEHDLVLSTTGVVIGRKSAGSGAAEELSSADLVSLIGSSTWQPLDADLTSWAAITRATGFDTFATTPSSANLRALLTDETGTGAAVFAGSPALTGTPTLAGSSSGTTGIQASATASGTLTLPAATDTLVGKATTDTLTNKTIDLGSNTVSYTPSGTGGTSRSVSSKLNEFVSVVDFGAVASSSGAASANSTAFQNALATGAPVYVPDGATYYIQNVTVPTNAHSIQGNATLIAGGTIATSSLITVGASAGFLIRNLTIQINTTTYTTLDAIDATGATDFIADNVTVNGYNGILCTGCTGVKIRDCSVTNFNNIGIVTRASDDVKITGNTVTTTNTTTSNYGIQVSEGVGVGIHNNDVSSAYNFGIVVSGRDGTRSAQSSRIAITGNRTLNTGIEGINVTNGDFFTISANVCEWTNGSSRDFWISVWGDPNTSGTVRYGTISGNSVYQSGKAGIALANNASYVTVSGNTIYNANTLNGATAYHIEGILVYGRGANHNKVVGNNVIDTLSHLTWATNEYDDGIGLGAPDYNSFSDTSGVGTSGACNVIGSHSSVGDPLFYFSGPSSYSGAYPVTVYDPALPISDAHFAPFNTSDATKQGRFSLSGVTTGTTRTLTWPDANGTIALTGNKLSVFAATTSAELAGVISDETGTGALVFANSPTLVTPNIGAATGTSVTLTSSAPFTATGANANFELGAKGVANTPFIDFNSSGNNNDFDSRLVASGGGASSGLGSLTLSCAVLSTYGSIVSTANGIGYATGAGGTVTQATSKSTGVTLSKTTGQITLNAAALAASTTVSFTLTNTYIAATDVLVLNHISGGTAGSYTLNAQCAAGSASINVRNVSLGSLSEAIVIQFCLIKGVTA